MLKCRSAILFVLLALSPAIAVSPHLTALNPTGAQRGTETEITFTGERLQDTEEIICYEPGIEIAKLKLTTNQTAVAQLKIAPDCPLGEHHLRLRAASGLSELITFFVGPFPVLTENEPNNDPAKAQNVPLNTTVTGIITNDDVDCFAVELKKGQRFSAEVEGIRLGRALFDSRLSVLDSKGSLVADADDTWLALQDPFLSFIVPEDGTYIVRVREVTYGGSDKYYYRLHFGTFPRPTSVYPLGGKVGETLTFTCFSEATGEFKWQIKLPDTPQEKFGLFAELDGLPTPSPNWIRVSLFPNVLAVLPNQDREHATTSDLSAPLALNGIIATKGQEDWFRFRAAKDTALKVTVFARRLRTPMDAVIEIFDSAGKSLASNDDTAGVDSSLKFTPTEATNYFLCIRDTLHEGGRDFAYRVEITPTQPKLSLKIPEVSRNDTQSRQFITVPRGNRFATLISAKRANFDGELRFDIQGLPTGVQMFADRMSAKIDAMPLVFEAASDAPIGGKLLDLTASGTNNGGVTAKFVQEVELVQGPPNNVAYYSTSVDKLCVAVTKEAPFKLRIVEPKVPVVQAGSMRLEIIAERAPGFDEPIEVNMVWNPPGISSQSEATIPKGATNVFYQLNAGGAAETRVWKIAALAHATVEGGKLYVSSQLTDLEVATPFVTGKIETAWVNPGKTAKITVNLQQAKTFNGNATIRLVGLPDKVTATQKEITKADQEVVFDLATETNCPIGSHKNLFCAVDITQNGQVIPHTIASGGILRIVPPKKEEPKPTATAKK
ncbi:MAG TPA: PPC domain-containing protein [Candidatus Eisenbacteria bacterium]|nr:PPC domain-containing protein [Candidatus Eisenbacteria bacterium]